MARHASAPHDARISGRDSVLRRQFPKKPAETQCDTATAPRAERAEDRSRVRQQGMTIEIPADVEEDENARGVEVARSFGA